MIVGHFLRWIETAKVSERAAAGTALARAYMNFDLPFEERCAAEAALTSLLDDPSPKVRMALADALSMSRHAPAHIVSLLAADLPEIAAIVIARSPVLSDADLIDRAATGPSEIQRLIAGRPQVSMPLAAAIAEIADAEACLALIANPGATIASLSFRRIAERHGDIGRLRHLLLHDPRLPSECRHMLLVKLREALRDSSLVSKLMGPERAEKVTQEACLRASVTLIERTPAAEHAALVEHLRLRGYLTPALLVRALVHGRIDFFGSVLASLSGQPADRIAALVANGRDGALLALFSKAGLAPALHPTLLEGVRRWREVAIGRRVAGAQEIAWLMLQTADDTTQPLGRLLRSIYFELVRDNARHHAVAIAGAQAA